MFNRTMDLLFTDSFAFAINKTLGVILRTKICNYSWETKGDRSQKTNYTKNNRIDDHQ